MLHKLRYPTRTVRLSAVAIADLHRTSADTADTEIGFARETARLVWGRTIHGGETCLR